MELVRLPQAARQLGVSYPTLKQWIYAKKIRSIKTVGGHHRISRAEIDRLMFQRGSTPRVGRARHQQEKARHALSRRTSMDEPGTGLERFISGRNQLVGRVKTVQTVGLLTKVALDVGGQTVTAIITSDACRDLGLKVGETAAALIKATEVMIIRPARVGRF